ncbi:MAG: replication-associated recombination protein A [Candidatus Dormibacter sp.]|uniref:replication-associated recombination protein A n=1 Tax=Candidatus Dormibacter sp. TaxID=2973982 RepID=UPI000DB7887A|nr:MAG: AAA family ATPase [Candidatus Dormibacteraeota bacterium]
MREQGELFSDRAPRGEPTPPADAGRQADAPLASRLRPRQFSELEGQQEVVRTLSELAGSGRLPSLVLWGPPGSGKTTLARILAEATGAHLLSVSAVTSGVADLRKALAQAAEVRRLGRRSLLFIDELHRFNKAQQDAILPAVEDGTVTLIGATTENPSFEVNSPLLSRSRVFRLEPLDRADLAAIVKRGLLELRAELTEDAENALLELSRGDARVALNALEAAHALARGRRIELPQVEQALQQPHLLYDRAGDMHYDLASALIKSVRGSDPDAAVYWLARMLEAGEEVNFVARRLVLSAAEDVGLADPAALPLAVAAQQAAHLVGMPEAVLPLSEAAIYLALAAKSNSAYRAYGAARQAVQEHGNLPVPLHLRNAATSLMRELGYGAGYRYAHDFEGGKADQQHLPDALRGQRFYEPTPRDLPGPG